MRALLLSTDNILANAFRARQVFDVVDVCPSPEQALEADIENYDVLIISDRVVPRTELENIRASTGPSAKILYMVSNYPDPAVQKQVQMLCLSLDIFLVPPGQTVNQIVDRVCRVVAPDTETRSGNVVALFGAQPRSGVTMLTLSTARRLSAAGNIKIGVLGLNAWNPGDCYVADYTGLYLDDLKNYLNNKLLTGDDLLENMCEISGFRYLAGNRDIKKRLYYSIDEIHYLIDTARDAFDLVLIDAGAHFDNALTVQALNCADLRLLVTTQETSAYRNWKLAFDQVLQPLGCACDSFSLILNRYIDRVNYLDAKRMQDQYGIIVLQTVPDLGEIGTLAELNHTLLLDYNDREYNTALDRLVSSLAKLYGIAGPSLDAVQTRNRPGLFKKLFA